MRWLSQLSSVKIQVIQARGKGAKGCSVPLVSDVVAADSASRHKSSASGGQERKKRERGDYLVLKVIMTLTRGRKPKSSAILTILAIERNCENKSPGLQSWVGEGGFFLLLFQ